MLAAGGRILHTANIDQHKKPSPHQVIEDLLSAFKQTVSDSHVDDVNKLRNFILQLSGVTQVTGSVSSTHSEGQFRILRSHANEEPMNKHVPDALFVRITSFCVAGDVKFQAILEKGVVRLTNVDGIYLALSNFKSEVMFPLTDLTLGYDRAGEVTVKSWLPSPLRADLGGHGTLICVEVSANDASESGMDVRTDSGARVKESYAFRKKWVQQKTDRDQRHSIRCNLGNDYYHIGNLQQA